MTSMIRWSPSTELRRMQHEIDNLFSGFFEGSNGDLNEGLTWTPRADLFETDEAYMIHMDLPGLTKEDLEINFQDGRLAVRGERQEAREEERGSFIRVERGYGRFFRSFRLPRAVRADDISAHFENGVLKITVPKTEELKPRRIEVVEAS